MRTGKLSLENIITGLFITLMGSVFLLCAQGYRTISDGKYHMFIIVCGGYCAVMIFIAFQRFVLESGDAPKYAADNTDSLQNTAAPAAKGSACADAGVSAVGDYAMRGYYRTGAVTRAAAIIYIIITLISALCSDYFPETIFGSARHEGTLTIAIYGLTFIFVSRHYRPHLLHAAIFGASVIVFDVISLLQAAGMNPFGLYPDGLSWADRNVKYNGEFIGTIGNADLVSAFLCVAIPLTAVMGVFLILSVKKETACHEKVGSDGENGSAETGIECRGSGVSIEGSGTLLVSIADKMFTEKNVIKKLMTVTGVLCLTAAALSLVLLAVIKVTASLLAMAFVCLIAAPVAAYIFSDVKKRKMIAAYLVALMLAGCAAGAFIYVETSLPGTAGELHEIMHGNIDDSFGTGRVYIYRNIMERVPSHLLLGTGPDTIGHMDIAPFQRYDAKRGVMVTARIDVAHNELLNVLACQGILALGAYLAFALGVMAAALRGIVNCAAALRGARGSSRGAQKDNNSAAALLGRVGPAAALCGDVNCAAASARPEGGAGHSDAAAAAVASTALALSASAYLIQSMFAFSSCTTAPYFWITCAIIISTRSMKV